MFSVSVHRCTPAKADNKEDGYKTSLPEVDLKLLKMFDWRRADTNGIWSELYKRNTSVLAICFTVFTSIMATCEFRVDRNKSVRWHINITHIHHPGGKDELFPVRLVSTCPLDSESPVYCCDTAWPVSRDFPSPAEQTYRPRQIRFNCKFNSNHHAVLVHWLSTVIKDYV